MNRQPDENFERLRTAVAERLARNQKIRRNLPGGGRLRIDRQLPFLCVYRQPSDRKDRGARDLITTEAAYLFEGRTDEHHEKLVALCDTIAETLHDHFDAFLFIEVWTEEADETPRQPGRVLAPAFDIVTAVDQPLTEVVAALREALAEIRLDGQSARVREVQSEAIAPPGMRPLLSDIEGAADSVAERQSDEQHPEATGARLLQLGLVVRPVFREAGSGVVYPMLLHRLRRQLSRALRRAVFAFASGGESNPLAHFDSLGPSAHVRATRLVDQELCEVSESFDFLLQVTPVNSEQAWQSFSESGYREVPRFYYRPLPHRPDLLKRRLFEIPIERIEDPTLMTLFSQKQVELDRQISALRDRGTEKFLFNSLQLYGEPDRDLVRLAKQILEGSPEVDEESIGEQEDAPAPEFNGHMTARTVAERAREEVDHYHSLHAPFSARVEVCDDIASGLMVAGDRLLISRSFQASGSRVEPLLHHEVGTHLLTYFNGREQPFRQLYAGLAGYDALQEGLAVLAEYFAGGLTFARLRTVAARVIAARSLVDGAAFLDTFQLLFEEFAVSARTAFSVTLRAYRGGGLTKDISYLQGLRDLLAYLREGHDIEPLYVGKIALEHVPAVQELRRRGIIQPPALLPRFVQRPDFRERLEQCRHCDVLGLISARTTQAD